MTGPIIFWTIFTAIGVAVGITTLIVAIRKRNRARGNNGAGSD